MAIFRRRRERKFQEARERNRRAQQWQQKAWEWQQRNPGVLIFEVRIDRSGEEVRWNGPMAGGEQP